MSIYKCLRECACFKKIRIVGVEDGKNSVLCSLVSGSHSSISVTTCNNCSVGGFSVCLYIVIIV